MNHAIGSGAASATAKSDGASAVGARYAAPAKLNLFLHIIGRRADGYHLLQTLFQFLDHGDTLDFEVHDDARVERPLGPAGVAPEEDLAVKAARLLQERAGVRRGVSIHLRKILPREAGLG